MHLRFWGVVGATLVFVALNAKISTAVDKTWDNGGATDFWDDDDNWDPNEKPQPGDNAIVGGNPEVNTLEIFNQLTNTGTIDITTGTLQPQGNVDNTGTINIGDGSAIVSQLIIGNSTTLSGGGEVVLRNSDDLPASNAVLRGGTSAADVVTNGAGHTVRGEGSILQHWINEGVFRAEETSGDSTAVLRLDGTTFENNGELRSSSGASIVLDFATYSQAVGGQLIADSDNITLTGVTSVTGGSLESVGGGVFEVDGLVTLSGVTVSAPIDNTNIDGDGRLYSDSGGITNNSTITLDGQNGRNAQFGFTSSGTLDGTGDIVLVGGDSNTFVGVFPGIAAEFTQGTNHTIRGAGRINSRMINNGTIRAEPGTNGSILLVNGFQTNNGLMEAGTGATLEFQANASTTIQGAGGIIRAADGGTVVLETTTINGGSFQSVGSGRIVVAQDVRVAGVVNSANIDVEGTFVDLIIDGDILTNNGIISLNANNASFGSTVAFTQDATLDGTGEVVLNATGGNSILAFAAGTATAVITQEANHTVRGEGRIEVDFVNRGRLEGNSAAEPIEVFGRLSGAGAMENVVIAASIFNGFGVHAPGESTAIVAMDGLYEITNSATLEIELGGTAPGSGHDQLASTGTVELGGILDVSLVDLNNGYAPMAGDQFKIITAIDNTISGTFDSENFPQFALGHELTWEPIDYQPGAVTIEIATATPYDVDLDNDGDVDGTDFLLIQRSDPSLIPAWEFEYGSVTPVVAQAVPEPSSALFVIVVFSMTTCASRWQRPSLVGESHKIRAI